MKRYVTSVLLTLYAFFALGFFLHTSAHPEIFGKYTFKYLLILVSLILTPVAIGLLMRIPWHKTTFKIKKNKFIISPTAKNILLLILLSLIALTSLEFYLRQQYKNYESNTYMYTLDNFDPFLQFKPTQSYAPPINAYGFRGEEMQKQKPKGTYRIFVLGGSTVLSRGSTFEKTSVQRLEKKLSIHYPNQRIEIINAGVDGYTSEHSLIQYLFKIKDFDPDMIIMWHGINDWYYSCTNPEKTYGNFSADYSHYLSADATMAKNYFKPEPILTVKLLSVDFFIKFAQDNWYSDLLHWSKEKRPFEGFYTEATKQKQYEMTSYPSLQSYERNLQSLIDATQKDNVSLILGNQPVLYVASLGKAELKSIYFPVLHCTKDGKYPTFKSVTHSMQQFNKTTQDIAASNEVSFIDLNTALPKTKEYYTDDVHYTDKGNEKISEALYQFIVTNELLEK